MERQRQDIVVTIRDRRGCNHDIRIFGARAKLSNGYIRSRCIQLLTLDQLEFWFCKEYPFTDDCIVRVIKEYATYRMSDKDFFKYAARTVEKRVKVEI